MADVATPSPKQPTQLGYSAFEESSNNTSYVMSPEAHSSFSSTTSPTTHHSHHPRTRTTTDDSHDDDDDDDERHEVASSTADSVERRNLLEDVDAASIAETCSLPGFDPFIIDEKSLQYYDDCLPGCDPFIIDEKSLQYYDDWFDRLLMETHQDHSGALEGALPQIRQFFESSGLTTEELSQVWSLADINQDGFLNRSEFHIAMHLIVLRVKAGYSVPELLPDTLHPTCITPPRAPQMAQTSAALETPVLQQSSAQQSPCMRQFTQEQPPQLTRPIPVKSAFESPQQQQGSAEVPKLLSSQQVTSLIQSTNPSNQLELLSPKGGAPPPPPPPRPANRHARSASLDLTKPNTTGSTTQHTTPRARPARSDKSATLPHGQVCTSERSDHDYTDSSAPAPAVAHKSIQVSLALSSQQSRTAVPSASTPMLDFEIENTLDLATAGLITAKERCHQLRTVNAALERQLADLVQQKLSLQPQSGKSGKVVK